MASIFASSDYTENTHIMHASWREVTKANAKLSSFFNGKAREYQNSLNACFSAPSSAW